MQGTLRRYRLLEARSSLGWAPVVGLLVAWITLGLASALLPRMPDSAVQLLERVMLLRGMGAVVLVNDYLALYFVTYFVGVAGLLRALVEPKEERSLEVLLSKPLPRRVFLEARVLPVLLATAGVGGLTSLAQGLAALPYAHEGTVSVAGAVGAGLVLTALCLLLLSLLVVPLLLVKDSFQGLIIALVVWMPTMIPCSVLIYRPDVFEGREALRNLTSLPANLLWFDMHMPRLAPVLLAVALVAARLALALGARVLERTEPR